MAPPDFKTIEENIKASLIALTKSVHQLANEDLAFHRSASSDVASQLDDANDRICDLTSSLLKSATKATRLRAPRIEDAEDIDARWKGIIDVVDSLLEKADTNLDEFSGLVKRKESLAAEPVSPLFSAFTSISTDGLSFPSPRTLLDQQLLWERKVPCLAAIFAMPILRNPS